MPRQRTMQFFPYFTLNPFGRYVQLEESNQELLHNMSVVFGAPLRLKDLTSVHLVFCYHCSI